MVQTGVKLETVGEHLKVQHLQDAVLENVETWETASVLYKRFNFSKVPGEERKFICLLAKELGEVDWSTLSAKNWVTKLQWLLNENFVVSRCGQIAVVFKTDFWHRTLVRRVQRKPTTL